MAALNRRREVVTRNDDILSSKTVVTPKLADQHPQLFPRIISNASVTKPKHFIPTIFHQVRNQGNNSKFRRQDVVVTRNDDILSSKIAVTTQLVAHPEASIYTTKHKKLPLNQTQSSDFLHQATTSNKKNPQQSHNPRNRGVASNGDKYHHEIH